MKTKKTTMETKTPNLNLTLTLNARSRCVCAICESPQARWVATGGTERHNLCVMHAQKLIADATASTWLKVSR